SNDLNKDIFYYKIEEKASLLSKLKGTMGLQSDPAGCSIFINDLQLVNKTPFTQEIQAGVNKISLKKERYLDLDTLLDVKPDQLNNFSLTLKPAWANLEIKAKPEHASVSLNNIPQGSGTVRFTGVDKGLTPGEYAVKVEAPKHRPSERKLFLTAGQNESINIALVPMQGELKVSGSPENWKCT
ncbi:MAG: PEGA domain-containing protein, partial [Bacteroidia bacterium]